MRPIDADPLIDDFKRIARICASGHDTDGAFIADLCIHKVECVAPTLDVRPVVHGHWIHPSRNSKIDNKAIFSDCSVCGYSVAVIDAKNYCPNCGNPMDEKEEEDKLS